MNDDMPGLSVAPILHGGGVTDAARLYGGAVSDWLDLSTGINPNPVPLPDIPADAWHRLPDRHLFDTAREAARLYYGARASLPLPVPGTQSAIQHLPKFADPARPVAVLSPTYGEYARVLSEAGFQVDPIAGLSDIRPEHGLVVVVNPNNPTGRRFSRTQLLGLAERLSDTGARLHIDEAFADGAAAESLAADAGSTAGLTIFRSFGKYFGLAGLRLGFVLAEPDVLARFANRLGPWAVSGPALAVAASLMHSDLSSIRSRIDERHAALIRVLLEAGLPVVGGTHLFALVDHPDAARLHDHLCRRRVLVRKFDYNGRWLRFGLAPNAEADARLAAALSDFAG